MSADQPSPEHNSVPASSGGLLLRVALAIGIVVVGAVALVWYANR
ncbi:hypothetical protein [Frigoriglobus tundricola]|uniref:Uncharacterized protein n=1 Tax=Frigoriglobus tundricola TaxID=2774151 RepID=A0A6M5Z5W1_9BACT|nr:hypothetical protein [Frigoriglobus tundricola]QJX01227.1 hypothetical protein FTUN_8866 [Frigoriglobus tundricola]